MRQISIIGAVGGLIAATLTASSASAAPAPIAVDGNHFGPSSLTLVSQGCVDSRAHPIEPPTFHIKRGPGDPPIGNYSSGWAEPGSTYGVGVTARVSDPTMLKTLGISLNAADGARGHVVATYHDTGDTGVWQGNADLGDDTTKGWHRVNAAQVVYTWTHLTNGTIDRTDADGTLQDFATRQGGDGNGAEVGVIYGCDGNPFFTDAFSVATKASSRVFDLGGYRAVGTLKTYPKIAKKIHVTYGVAFNLTGTLTKKFNGKGLAGPLRIQARPPSASSWQTIAQKTVGTDGAIKSKVQPARSVTYRLFYPGNATYEDTTSRNVTVIVSPYISAAFADSSVVKGHPFTLRGQVLPKRHGAIQLQRFLSGHWKTVKKGSTNADGKYAISGTTTRAGKSYWRIRVPAGGGNAAGTSPWRKLTTSVPSSGGSMPPTQNDPPPPPQDDPPPPPPPTH